MKLFYKLVLAPSLAFAMGILAMSARGDVVYTSQTRSVSATLAGGGTVVAPDYLEFNESVTVRNEVYGNSASASQHSTLGATRIDARGGSSASGGFQGTGGNSSSFFEVTFTIDAPTTYSLFGYWQANSGSRSLADVRVEFVGPSGTIYSSRSTRGDVNNIYLFNDDYDVSGTLVPGTYRLTTYSQGSAFGSTDSLGGSFGLTLLVPKPVPGPCQGRWLPNDSPSVLDGPIYSMVNWDPDGPGPLPSLIISGGSFTMPGSAVLNNIAALDPATEQWSPLGTGMNGAVRALAVLPNGELLAGGDFTMAGSVSVNHVARWNGTNWSALGAGPDETVRALLLLPDGDVAAASGSNVARWNGTVWTQLGAGLNGTVLALTLLPNGDIAAGGDFFFLINDNVNYGVAMWNGSDWVPMGGGMPFVVYSMVTMPNGDVVAGDYDAHIHSWNGSFWSPLGNRTNRGAVFAMTVMPNGDLIAAGGFDYFGPSSKYPVTRWNGTSWTTLSSMNNNVYALAPLPDGGLLAGGEFTAAGDVSAQYVARWNNSAWSALDPGTGMNAEVTALTALPSGELVAGGAFTTSNGISTSHIAIWNGSDSTALGAGVNGSVYAMQTLTNGDLIAGGDFTTAGNAAANHIARWDGSAWSTLGTGMNGAVSALVVMPNGDLVAGGDFTTAGGASANRIARWDGSAWSALGTGMDGDVYALALLPNGDLVAGGRSPNGFAVASWNGTAWSPLATGIDTFGYVKSLAVLPDGDLVAGGLLFNVGGVSTSGIARWDGTAWSALGTGFGGGSSSPLVYSLVALPDGSLVAGGTFRTAGGVSTRFIARWDGVTWSALGSGTNASVLALTVLPNGDLVAGGRFTRAGGNDALHIAQYAFGSPADITQQPAPTATCHAGSASFSVGVSAQPLSFAWQVEIAPQGSGVWTDLSDGTLPPATGSSASVTGTTTDTLTIGEADIAAALSYRVILASECGNITSDAAILTVCIGDYNCDGGVDGSDVQAFLSDWESASPAADLNANGGIDGEDVEVFFVRWESGC